MRAKHLVAAVAIGVSAIASSVGYAQLRVSQLPILSYCPSHAGNVDCGTAVKLFLQFTKPTDDELVTIINAVMGQLAAGRHSRTAYNNTVGALGLLASAIRDKGQRTAATLLIETVIASAPIAIPPIASGDLFGDSNNHNGRNSGSGGSHGGSSGTSGTSGTSGQSSGSTSGDETGGGAG